MSFNILKKAHLGFTTVDDSFDVRPKVSRVVGPFSFAGSREGLTGIAASEDANFASKRFQREGLKIRPDRCRNHPPRFHLVDQVRNCEGFDLHMSEDSDFPKHSLKTEFESSISRAEG